MTFRTLLGAAVMGLAVLGGTPAGFAGPGANNGVLSSASTRLTTTVTNLDRSAQRTVSATRTAIERARTPAAAEAAALRGKMTIESMAARALTTATRARVGTERAALRNVSDDEAALRTSSIETMHARFELQVQAIAATCNTAIDTALETKLGG